MKSNISVMIVVTVSVIIGLFIGVREVKYQKNVVVASSYDSGDINILSGDKNTSGEEIILNDEKSVEIFSGEGEIDNIGIIEEKNIDVLKDIKAIYITGWGIGTKNIRESVIKTMKENGYNAIVVDIKNDEGQLSYNSNVKTAIDIEASKNMIGNIEKVIEELHQNDIYVIGRIVTFKDPILAGSPKTVVAYRKEDGSVWKDYNGNSWPNPYNKNSWEYSIELAKEAASYGFDEIQFDYVKFPTYEGDVKQIKFGFDSSTISKSEIINEFLKEAVSELKEYDVVVSSTVSGITSKNVGDFENIGQDFEKIAEIVDVICPIVFPSDFGFNSYGISKPDLNPYDIIYKSLSDAIKRSKNVDKNVVIRPYLQDFTATWLGSGNYLTYGTEQVQSQIKALYDLSLKSFTLFDSSNKYCYEALKNIEN